MSATPRWSEDEMDAARRVAIDLFRRTRVEEPLEDYLEQFDAWLGKAEELLELTVDLTDTKTEDLTILTDEQMFYVFRYLPGPPTSLDDLKTLVGSNISRKYLRHDPELRAEVVQLIMDSLDRRRFPWVSEGREPTEAERKAATIATAALLAMRRVGTNRRTISKTQQEDVVRAALKAHNFKEVQARKIHTLADAPGRGEFCGESEFGSRKADFVVRLWDDRVMAIECKVSNSALNSIKRLNNDAAVKAVKWLEEFGHRQVVPSAVLSGVYDLTHLMAAQRAGLTIFWAHDLTPMLNWIESTKD